MIERTIYKIQQDPARTPAAWLAAAPRQLNGEATDVRWLDPRRLGQAPALPEAVRAALSCGGGTGVNTRHPRRERALEFVTPRPRKKRGPLPAGGDGGGTLLATP